MGKKDDRKREGYAYRGEGDFEDPPAPESEESGEDDEFEAPEGGAEERMGEELFAARDAIEEALAREAGADARVRARSSNGPNVVGVGLSRGASSSGGGIPGEGCLIVFVENPSDDDVVRRELHDSLGARAAAADELPVEVVVTGPIEALSSNRSRFRPSAAGLSCGHPRITAGTIGGWARGLGERGNRLLLVSNNHVVAASNKGRYGDSILQPGPADGGIHPKDRIAILERFANIAFGGAPNYVDCATGWCWTQKVRRDHVYHQGTKPIYFKVGASPLEPQLNRIVGKTGRTTNLTQGRITATGVSINVNFGVDGVAHFRDQFAVRSLGSEPFSAGGDSGSFVWTWDSGRRPVGLLFAGGGGTTFCNRMARVLSALDIHLI